MNTVVLVGLRMGDELRDRNWAFNRARWEAWGYRVVEGHHDADEGPYSMAIASNRAAAAAGDWDLAIYAGADFFAGGREQVEAAAERARGPHGLLTFAHEHLTLLEEHASAWVTDCVPAGAALPAIDYGTRHPNTFSGVLAVNRELWERVGGFDERFVGWGWEDLAFWWACNALGPGYNRVPGDIYHLWHPRSWEENEGNPNHSANQVLGERYRDAKSDQVAMRAILAER